MVLVGKPETLFLQPSGGPRTCVRAQFKKVGASTPGGHFRVTLFHTPSGSPKSDVSIDALNPLQFKQDRRGAEIYISPLEIMEIWAWGLSGWGLGGAGPGRAGMGPGWVGLGAGLGGAGLGLVGLAGGGSPPGQGRAGQGRTGRCDCAHVAGEDMLRRCMRATFTDVSTLGIVMGDTNMTCGQVEDATQYGHIGSTRLVEYHPGPQLLEICSSNMKEGRAGKSYFAHPKPKECTDFIFAGDAEVDPVKPLPLVSLDGEHIAIAARVVFNGPLSHAISSLLPGESSGASTRGCHHGVAQRDIDAAKKMLERKTPEDMWVPHERALGDKHMAKLVRKQTQDKMKIELLHVLENDDQARARPEIRNLADEYEGDARALRSKLREHSERRCASTPAETDPLHILHAWELNTIGQLHAEEREPIQQRQGEYVAQASFQRMMKKLTATQREASADLQEEKAQVDEIDDSSSYYSSCSYSSCSRSGSGFVPNYERSPTRSSYESDASTLEMAGSHHDDQQGQQQDQNPQQPAAAAASSSSSRSCRRSSRR